MKYNAKKIGLPVRQLRSGNFAIDTIAPDFIIKNLVELCELWNKKRFVKFRKAKYHKRNIYFSRFSELAKFSTSKHFLMAYSFAPNN